MGRICGKKSTLDAWHTNHIRSVQTEIRSIHSTVTVFYGQKCINTNTSTDIASYSLFITCSFFVSENIDRSNKSNNNKETTQNSIAKEMYHVNEVFYYTKLSCSNHFLIVCFSLRRAEITDGGSFGFDSLKSK